MDKIQTSAMMAIAMTMAMPAPPLPSVARAASAAPEHVLEEDAENQFAEEAEHAGDHHGDHHHAHVAIADMGELVAEHGLKFLVVERFDEPARHGDGILFLVHAGGEGVERLVIGDAQRRRGDAARDAEVFQEIVEPRFLLARVTGARPGYRVDHRLVEFVGNENPNHRAHGGERQRLDEVEFGRAEQVIKRRSAARDERLGEQRAGEHHDVDQKEQSDQQRDRAALVRLDMRIETVGGHDVLRHFGVMAGLVPASHALRKQAWMPGTRPGMTA